MVKEEEEEEEKAMRSFISEFLIKLVCPSNFVDCPSLMIEDQTTEKKLIDNNIQISNPKF
jgi:hypothetical protein